jgi:hypothetical protein
MAVEATVLRVTAEFLKLCSAMMIHNVLGGRIG